MKSGSLTPTRRDGGPSRLRRWARRALAGLAVSAALLFSAGALYQFAATKIDARAYPAPGRLVDVGGYRLHLNCAGEGGPTVLLEAGLGGGVLDWSLVQPEVARFSRVCSYDHAGAGWSDAGPAPRDARRLVEELHTLLGNAGLRPPYVLVGHSLGGLNVQLYASRYPDEVAGVVLVDSSHEGQALREELPNPSPRYSLLMKALAPVGAGRVLLRLKGPSERLPADLAEQRAALYSHTGHLYSVADEFSSMSESMRQLRESPMRLGDRPLVVLTRGEAPPSSSRAGAEKAESVWRELQADLAGRSSRGRQVIARRSGHFIQFDEPGLVVDAVREVLDSVAPLAGDRARR